MPASVLLIKELTFSGTCKAGLHKGIINAISILVINLNMLLLKIKKPVRFKPKKYDPDAKSPSGGTMFTQFIGDHPINPEQGTVFIDVALIDGSFENISDILFIEDEPTKGKLIGYKKNLLGGYRIEVEIDTVFRHGLEYMT